MSESQERLCGFVESAKVLTELTDEQILSVLSHWFWFAYPWDEVDEGWVNELGEAGFIVSAEAMETLALLRDRLDGTIPMPSVEQTLGTEPQKGERLDE